MQPARGTSTARTPPSSATTPSAREGAGTQAPPPQRRPNASSKGVGPTGSPRTTSKATGGRSRSMSHHHPSGSCRTTPRRDQRASPVCASHATVRSGSRCTTRPGAVSRQADWWAGRRRTQRGAPSGPNTPWPCWPSTSTAPSPSGRRRDTGSGTRHRQPPGSGAGARAQSGTGARSGSMWQRNTAFLRAAAHAAGHGVSCSSWARVGVHAMSSVNRSNGEGRGAAIGAGANARHGVARTRAGSKGAATPSMARLPSVSSVPSAWPSAGSRNVQSAAVRDATQSGPTATAAARPAARQRTARRATLQAMTASSSAVTSTAPSSVARAAVGHTGTTPSSSSPQATAVPSGRACGTHAASSIRNVRFIHHPRGSRVASYSEATVSGAVCARVAPSPSHTATAPSGRKATTAPPAICTFRGSGWVWSPVSRAPCTTRAGPAGDGSRSSVMLPPRPASSRVGR